MFEFFKKITYFEATEGLKIGTQSAEELKKGFQIASEVKKCLQAVEDSHKKVIIGEDLHKSLQAAENSHKEFVISESMQKNVGLEDLHNSVQAMEDLHKSILVAEDYKKCFAMAEEFQNCVQVATKLEKEFQEVVMLQQANNATFMEAMQKVWVDLTAHSEGIFMFYIFAHSCIITTAIIQSWCDAGEDWQIGFQDPATPSGEGMIYFFYYMSFYLIIVASVVGWLLGYLIFGKFKNDSAKFFTHSSSLEVIWTIIPSSILLFISISSFSLLYALEESMDPVVTLKVIGHQWYWSYEYSDYDITSLKFDSYMEIEDELSYGSFRLLEVDNRVYLPVRSYIRVLITAADVLHSWAIPSFGIKVDACPGRLSQAFLYIKREGVFYGQCSEICGVNHGFMPIVVSSISAPDYLDWVEVYFENEDIII